MNITILPGAATEDATQIDQIVQEMEQQMEELNATIKRDIPDGVDTTWSNTVRSNWERYYGADIPEAMAEMKLSAANLRLAVEQALQYDQEQ